jgi:hypothetical protein
MVTVVNKADVRLVILEHVNKCPHWSKTPAEVKDAAAAVVGSREYADAIHKVKSNA